MNTELIGDSCTLRFEYPESPLFNMAISPLCQAAFAKWLSNNPSFLQENL